ncbi:hypothetical protein [Alkaliphilus sp. B6464]|uniref:hypothetical protein n=1 Tax=Alkaliphilus sp. B6464 TaxID=2731219 RepID=UPI001BAB8809|nr:hypothetical protein [Alkaliphilus sp. B6464]QUH22166.1 hypothetical protein HYG84_19860 [Alkaliphilus sp. B6464]
MKNINFNLLWITIFVAYVAGLLNGFLIGGKVGWKAGFDCFARNKEIIEQKVRGE